MDGDSHASALLERGDAVRAGVELLDRAIARNGGALFIVAEAGLGKTSLLGEIQQRSAADFRVGSARGDAMETWFPFGVIAQALGSLGASDLLAHPADMSNPDVRAGQFVAVLRWLTETASSPVALILDDLHWADADSLALLAYLVSTSPPPASDTAIPTNGGIDGLPDVKGSTVVYTHVTGSSEAIFAFDTSTAGPPTEVAPQASSMRIHAGIGDQTIVWEDYGFDPSAAEIVAYDRTTATTTRLTNDALSDVRPTVSADGSVIAWMKCDSSNNCSIWDATRSVSGSWTAHQLTSAGQNELADTNGSVVVYDSTRNGEQDIYWQPIGGGAESQLSFAGADRHPTVSGTIVTFEHQSTDPVNPNYDVYSYDMLGGALYRLTSTPQDETLSDVWSDPATGMTRVVWAASNGATGYDVFAASFVVAPPDAPISITHIGALANRQGQAAAGVTFTDADPQGNLSQYTGSIDWGDGSVATPAVIAKNPFGGFAAGGVHTYAAPGTYTVTITIHDVGGAADRRTTSVVVPAHRGG